MYFAYVTAAEPAAGLEAIASPPPEESVELNWLNVFYAVEWAVFAGFAIFLWYRLVRDAVERERDAGRGGGGRATDAAEAAAIAERSTASTAAAAASGTSSTD